MSKLPNLNEVIISERKVKDYLLNLLHKTGRGKAIFFMRFGFTQENWEVLADALRQHATTHDVSKTETTPFGERYVIEGQFMTPDNRNPKVRSIWFLEKDHHAPHLVSAYPIEEES